MRRTSLLEVSVAALCCAVGVACGTTPAADTQPLRYVALGDSVAAEPGVPDPAPPPGCQKSTNNYPSVLARRLKPAAVTDVTCSGATSADITSRAQLTADGAVPPQIDAVEPDTTLITVTIGGNDVGLAADAAQCRGRLGGFSAVCGQVRHQWCGHHFSGHRRAACWCGRR